MRPLYLLSAAALATAGSFADEPAVEQDFSEIALRMFAKTEAVISSFVGRLARPMKTHWCSPISRTHAVRCLLRSPVAAHWRG